MAPRSQPANQQVNGGAELSGGQLRDAFGEAGLIDLTHLIGMYLAASALLNAFEVPAPASEIALDK